MWEEHPLFTIIGGTCLVTGLALIILQIINRLFRKENKHTKNGQVAL